MYVDAVIHTGIRRNLLVLPVSAILRDEKNEPLVYVQQQGQPGRFAQRSVTLGPQQGNLVAIRAGSRRASRWSPREASSFGSCKRPNKERT